MIKLVSFVYGADWSNPARPGTNPNPATFKDLEVIFEKILNIVVALAGIVVFIFLLSGGFQLLLSAGDPEKVKKATGTITWAIMGLVILLGIWFIFLFIHQFTGIDVTQFTLP